MDELSLSLTGKRWILAPLDGRDGVSEDDAEALIDLMRRSRALDEADDSEGDNSWHDPMLFPDAYKAAERVKKAVAGKEMIGIFGDYDCDGITATAQILRALKRRKNEPVVRLPHRVHDGYGLKVSHIDEFAEKNVTLLITVDTGISAHEAVEYARSKKIDVIILDHHHLLGAPNAFAIMHPALAPDFPHPYPSAAGVAFTFLHALEDDMWADRDNDLALALFGTVADLVPLKGFNRSLVREGLRATRRLTHGPIKDFIEQVSPAKALTSVDVAFRIAPRINAAGRMANPLLALKALMEGGALLRDLDTLNALRQDETSRALEKALIELTPDAKGELPAFLSIASTSYPHGILGLLAGKLTEKHGRPSMAVHIAGELCTASMRSTVSYNIVEALERHKELLQSFGGHAQAAGATFKLDHYMELTDALEKDARKHIPKEALTPSLAIDAILSASHITHDFCISLSSLEPFGQGNPEPMFLLENARLTQVRRVGADGKHLQAMLGDCKIIGFNLGDLIDEVSQPLDIVCRAGIDTWNGQNRPQLFLQDMRHPVGTRKRVTSKLHANR